VSSEEPTWYLQFYIQARKSRGVVTPHGLTREEHYCSCMSLTEFGLNLNASCLSSYEWVPAVRSLCSRMHLIDDSKDDVCPQS